VHEDAARAFDWLERAADAGSLEAQVALGTRT
jgi:TPR repeat protein